MSHLLLSGLPYLLAVTGGGAGAGGGLPGGSPSPTPVSPFPSLPIKYWWLLSATVWIPVAMAAVMAFLPEPRQRGLRIFYGFGFWSQFAVLCLAFFAYNQASELVPGLQYEEQWPWLPAWGAGYHLAADGISIPLLLIVNFIALLAIFASGEIRERPRAFFILMLLAVAGVNGVIAARDLFLLVLFWGATSIPLGLLVWGWGGPRREVAALRLLAFAGASTALLAAAAFVFYANTGGASFDMDYLLRATLPNRTQLVIAALVLLAAAIRLPLVPFHGWVRDVYAEAPAPVAILIAGAVAPLGGYLLIRVLVYGLHDGAKLIAPAVAGLAALTLVYAGLVAFRAPTLRRFAAYAAMAPMALIALGIGGLTPLAILGAAFQLIAGGLAAALIVGVCAVIARRAQTAEMGALGGIAPRMPRLSWLLVLAALALVGLPGSATFWSELFAFFGSFYNQPAFSFGAAIGLAVVAAAVAWTLQRTLFGRAVDGAGGVSDADLGETWYLGLLIGALLWFGILPGGPKIGGQVTIFDQGIVNILSNTVADIAGPFAPPDRSQPPR